MSVREIHNSLVSDPNDDGLKYARDKENNIIIRDSTIVEPLKLEISCGQKKTKIKGIKKLTIILNVIYMHG